MNPLLETAVRAAAAYFIILILARFMGRKMISQMTFFDFVVGVTAGSVTANVALGAQATPLRAVAVLAVLTLLTVLVDMAHLKSFLFTKAINSEPVVVIDRGKLKYANMQRVKLSVTELLTLLRQKNIFNLGDVDYAIFEIDGKLSVLPKAERRPLTPVEMGLTPVYRGIDRTLIIDGRIMAENLAAAGWSQEKLLGKLREQGVGRIQDVLVASLDADGSIYFSLKAEPGEEPGQYGID